MKLTGSQIIMECLAEQGVDTVFGYPGGAVLFIYDAIYKNAHRLKHILTSHEQGAAHAADGYARATGKTGVCIATSGPGATNLVTGIATAYMDSVPVVFITGNVSMDLIGKDSFQEADITGITIPITKNNYIVKDITKLADTLREAFAIAKSGRPGPVLVDIPKNISAETTEYEPATQDKLLSFNARGQKNKEVGDINISELAKLIKNSNKPFILCGGGIEIADASSELLTLAEKINAPVASTLMGLGGFPSSHPQFTGLLGMHGTKASNVASHKCDLFIAIGTRFSDRVIGDIKRFALDTKIVHIDIDRAEIDKNVLTYYSVVGDAKEVLSKVLPLIDIKNCVDWLSFIESLKLKAKPIEYNKSGSTHLTPYGIMTSIDNITDDNTIITTDVGQHQLWAAQYYKYNFPRTFVSSGGFGTMGYGLGAAIGSKLGMPEKSVVHIAGDGSFRMNCNELATVEHYALGIITIVFNNGVLGMVRQWQNKFYEKRFSQTTLDRGPDFVKLAEAYGIAGYFVDSQEKFDEAFKEALSSGKPAVLNCILEQDCMVTPMVAPGTSITNFVLD